MFLFLAWLVPAVTLPTAVSLSTEAYNQLRDIWLKHIHTIHPNGYHFDADVNASDPDRDIGSYELEKDTNMFVCDCAESKSLRSFYKKVTIFALTSDTKNVAKRNGWGSAWTPVWMLSILWPVFVPMLVSGNVAKWSKSGTKTMIRNMINQRLKCTDSYDLVGKKEVDKFLIAGK